MYLDKARDFYFEQEFQNKLTEELFENLKNKSFIIINKKIFKIAKISSVISVSTKNDEPTFLKKEPKKIKFKSKKSTDKGTIYSLEQLIT